MSEKPDSKSDRHPDRPPVPDPPNDGFPKDKDVSIPPPGSDVRDGQHKLEDEP